MYSSIFFLLREEECSHLHRIHCDEVWYYHDGAPLTIYILAPDGTFSAHMLGLDLANGQMPQLAVSAGSWFGAARKGPGFSLVGCMCAPCFRYDRFELMSLRLLKKEFPQHLDLLGDLVYDIGELSE